MTVYLVVDSALERELLPRLNAVKRAEVIGVARAPAEALEQIKHAKPHLVIIAVDPLDGSGIDFLTGMGVGDHRPLVYAVANQSCEQTRTRCTRAGASRYFDLSQLDRLVDSVATLASIC